MDSIPFDFDDASLGIFSYYPGGFSIVLGDDTRKVAWDEIEEIYAYKKDLMTVDEICLDIVLKETYVTITEEANGWEQFLIQLKIQFPTIDESWWGKVAFPAFTPNLTVIYKRE